MILTVIINLKTTISRIAKENNENQEYCIIDMVRYVSLKYIERKELICRLKNI